MRGAIEATEIWQDQRGASASVGATLAGREAVVEAATMLGRLGVRRIVASGNGASYYVAQALWLAALVGTAPGPDVVAVPGGLVARGAFPWREGDAFLAISSSGEFRDLVEALEGSAPPTVAVTAHPTSTVGRAARAVVPVTVREQRAITHTQAFLGAVAACLAFWAELVGDAALRREVEAVPEVLAEATEAAVGWAEELLAGVEGVPPSAVAFGTGPAWAAALEAALLVKEIARIPCEGSETREAVTAAMTAVLPGHLVLALPLREDPLAEEAAGLFGRLGARVARAPGGGRAAAALAAITTFPAALALSVGLALRAGHDPDRPAWIDTYYQTARAPR
jgi:fructoselysine-6-P-deglycase FrlB-like protein